MKLKQYSMLRSDITKIIIVYMETITVDKIVCELNIIDTLLNIRITDTRTCEEYFTTVTNDQLTSHVINNAKSFYFALSDGLNKKNDSIKITLEKNDDRKNIIFIWTSTLRTRQIKS